MSAEGLRKIKTNVAENARLGGGRRKADSGQAWTVHRKATEREGGGRQVRSEVGQKAERNPPTRVCEPTARQAQPKRRRKKRNTVIALSS